MGISVLIIFLFLSPGRVQTSEVVSEEHPYMPGTVLGALHTWKYELTYMSGTTLLFCKNLSKDFTSSSSIHRPVTGFHSNITLVAT